MLRLAVEEGFIESSLVVKLHKEDNARDRALSEEEYQKLLSVSLPHLRRIIHFHDLRHTFVTRKVKEGWDYKRIMAITGHKTFEVFQRYNNPTEEDIKAVVLATPPRAMVQEG